MEPPEAVPAPSSKPPKTAPWRSVPLAAAVTVLAFALLAPTPATSVGALSPADPRSPQNQALDKEFKDQIRPLLEDFCLSCHSGDSPKAGLDLSTAQNARDIARDYKTWEKVVMNIRSHVMPPPIPTIPTLEERGQIVSFIHRAAALNIPDQGLGRVTIRRLNKVEYQNTVRDLLGVEVPLAADFPSDDVGYGFDNIGDVLTLTPLHLEKYLRAARQATESAIPVNRPGRLSVDFNGLVLQGALRIADEGQVLFYSNAAIESTLQVARAGEYNLVISAGAQQAGPEDAKMAVFLNGGLYQTIDVKAPATQPVEYRLPLELPAGPLNVRVAFTNDFYQPDSPDPQRRDRNLHVHSLELRGPLGNPAVLSETARRVLVSLPTTTKPHAAAAREVIERFASRAYRRPVTALELDRLMKIYLAVRQGNEPYEEGVRVALQAVLVSPHFLFRVELDNTTDRAATRDLNPYELASRLSYFLWSTMPDQRLTDLAAQRKLNDPATLEAEVRRMLADPKASQFALNFGTQWLQTRRLAESAPDPQLFPGFDDRLKADLEKEAVLFVEDMLRQNRPVNDFVAGKHTFLNARLARHYGIPGAFGEDFRRTDVSAHRRGGLFGMASVLTVTSNPNRTSPVKRGKWIMEQILGTPPPPPPPDVGVLAEDRQAITAKTIRERLVQHRQDPSCNSCHIPLDAYGFSLENYDPVGRWRTHDGEFLVDNLGELPGDRKLQGLDDLKAYIIEREDDFLRSLAEKILVYAVGRGPTAADQAMLEQIAARVKSRGGKTQDLVIEIVKSDAFRKRALARPAPN